MTLLFDASGDIQLAHASLASRGITPVQPVQKDELKLRCLGSTLRRVRQTRPQTCYIFCRQMRSQFNRFPLKLAAALSGVKKIHFCDEYNIGAGVTPARVVFLDLPLYLAHCLYALVAWAAVAGLYALLWLICRLRKPVGSPGNSSRALCYIKTDFWHDLKAGGSVTHTREFINAGCELGYDIRIFSCDPLVHYKLRPKVEVVPPSPALYDLPILFSQLEYNLRFPLAVLRKMRGVPCDGIYQRHSSNNFSGVVLSQLLNVPFLLEHNSSSAWIAKNWSAEDSAIIPALCERLNFLGARRIAVVSETLKQNLVSAGIEPAKILVNPNGVDPSRFGPHVDASAAWSRLPSGKLLVGFIGVFGQWHGVLTLMRSVKHVIEACPQAQFVIIGDGALKQQMLDILSSDGTLQHVTFTGLVSHDAAPAYLNACDLLVSPHEDMADGSTFFGSPTKIFEYMATGKGIVASNVGQLGQILEHEREALLVGQRNELQLAAAITRLLRDPALRSTLGAAARSKVTSNFTWHENFRRAVAGFHINNASGTFQPHPQEAVA
jgi:glycosyltransferase involved in cell wall biosynthesis